MTSSDSPGHRGPVDADGTDERADWPPADAPDVSVGHRAAGSDAHEHESVKDASIRDLRETYRQQLLTGIGGWSGALIAAVPTTVFVIVNVASSLRIAIIAAVGSALALALYRLARKQPMQQALSGLIGVLIAAVIAARTGQERGYFLLGIITSFVYAVPFAISIAVRRPLVGLAWEFLEPTPLDDGVAWYRRRPLLLAYTWSTLAATAVFLVRGIVQLTLYRQNATGWLAFARIAMGYPLFVAAIAFSFLIVNRARKRVLADA